MNQIYEEFLQQIQNDLSIYFYGRAEVSIVEQRKNNGQKYKGLLVKDDTIKPHPVVYLEPFYEAYMDGLEYEKILERIKTIYEENDIDFGFSLSDFLDFEKIKECITFRIINYEKNEEMLAEVPYRRMLDLAIVYYYTKHDKVMGDYGIMIRNEHIDIWEKTEKELYVLSLINTPAIYKENFVELSALINGVMKAEEFANGLELLPMYVLTNESSFCGAGCILYVGLLEKIASELDDDMYILPSSIHEVIIIPKSCAKDLKCLKSMVEEVNSEVLEEVDILSDSVYYYDRKADVLSLC